jgi:hypothetical protein
LRRDGGTEVGIMPPPPVILRSKGTSPYLSAAETMSEIHDHD